MHTGVVREQVGIPREPGDFSAAARSAYGGRLAYEPLAPLQVVLGIGPAKLL